MSAVAAPRTDREWVTLRYPRRAWVVAAVVAVLASVLALLVDQWHTRLRLADAHAQARAQAAVYADALSGAVERRIALLVGLRSFANTKRTRRELDEEFALFSQGSVAGTEGVRALQLVERGRIRRTWPLVGNESVIGYDLSADPRAPVRDDVARALATGEVTVTGPIDLIQGGVGLLVRQRLTRRDGFPDLAAVILDVPALVREARIPDPRSELLLDVHDRQGRHFAGDSIHALSRGVRPETLSVTIADGDWRLLVTPRAGWDAMIRDAVLPFRLGAAFAVVLAALVALTLSGRAAQLERRAAFTGSQLNLALRAGRMGVWEWEVATRAVRWSDAASEIFGADWRTATDPIAEFYARVHADDLPRLQAVLRETALGERDDFMIEYRLMQADGDVRWILAIGELERDEEGRPSLVIGVVSDATDRRRLEDRLRHTQRLESVGKLAGGVAHDFNNLLTAIIGFGELARDRVSELPDSPQRTSIRDDLQELLQVAHKGAEVTGQLLAFSRRAPSEPTRVDLSAAVRETLPLLQRLLGVTVTVRADLAAALPPVWIDSAQLTQIVMNLVVNARDAMIAGGEIVVRTMHVPAGSGKRPVDAPHGEWVCLEVEDSGVGMTPEVQARIFEPYYTTKELGRGTGLGLAVVYGAVETARGVVSVRSYEGIGTSFRVYLPPYREPAR